VHFALTVQVDIPPELQARKDECAIRYQVRIRLDTEHETLQVAEETAWLPRQNLKIVERKGGRVQFHGEATGELIVERDQYGNYSSLNSIPMDDSFPAAARLRDLLRQGIRTVVLDPQDLAKPSPLPTGDVKKVTGSSLARQVSRLKSDWSTGRYQDWLAHIRTALPDVRIIDSVPREEEKSRFVMIEYENGVRVPQWMLSEGTLRLLALTILAYLPDFQGVYLIEEPENGVHPTALETIYQSLSSVYDAQVLVASHSPVLLSMAKPKQILCFSKTPEGTKIVRGSDHPALRDWQGEVSLGTMVASGILG
jgi:predicted ATPase